MAVLALEAEITALLMLAYYVFLAVCVYVVFSILFYCNRNKNSTYQHRQRYVSNLMPRVATYGNRRLCKRHRNFLINGRRFAL